MISHLECWRCGNTSDWRSPATVCNCGKPLKVVYDLPQATPADQIVDHATTSLWRYRSVLPPCRPISLGEGLTPLIHAPKLSQYWWVKDESTNPTGSFKARGMTTAVSMASHLGAKAVGAPSAGNAAGAMAAYAAAAGIRSVVYLPKDTPRANIDECEMFGAEVNLVEGLITDCAAALRARCEKDTSLFDLSTLKEPYRVEGKKTMGYELYEQLGRLPDVILYPTGGGTGLIGMWKAFDEMQALGWIGPERPRMVSVQADGCCPIVTAYERGAEFADEHKNARTVASGLRVPRAIGDFIMLDLIRKSNGAAICVSDQEMIQAAREMARTTGIFPCPEGGATLAAARKLASNGYISEDDMVVLFNTGTGLKYAEAFGSAN